MVKRSRERDLVQLDSINVVHEYKAKNTLTLEKKTEPTIRNNNYDELIETSNAILRNEIIQRECKAAIDGREIFVICKSCFEVYLYQQHPEILRGKNSRFLRKVLYTPYFNNLGKLQESLLAGISKETLKNKIDDVKAKKHCILLDLDSPQEENLVDLLNAPMESQF